MKNYFKYFVILPIALVACSCGKLEYMSRSSFAEAASGSILLQQPAFTNGQLITPEQQARIANRTMGGVSFTPSGVTKNGKVKAPLYFVLRRHKGEVSAETMLYESKNKEKTFLDNSILKFGIDRKRKGAGFDISLRW